MNDFVYNDGTDEFPSFLGNVEEKKGASIFEDAGAIVNAAGDFAGKQIKTQGMSCVLSWVDNGDFTTEAIDSLIQGMADLDGDGEIDAGDEENYYNDLYDTVADAMASLGADPDNIAKFINDEDDDMGATVGAMLSDKLDSIGLSDEELITNYALTASGDGMVTESFKKVVRGGVFKLIRKVHHIRRKISGALRATLRKARTMSHTATAMFHRKKSMKLRKQRGL